jgi:hypothetical protein
MAQELAKWEKFDRYMQSPKVAERLFGKSSAQARYVPSCAIRDPETGYFISGGKKRYLRMSDLVHQHPNRRCRVWRKN